LTHGSVFAPQALAGSGVITGFSGHLLAKPKLLLLDEPTAGMNPHETQGVVAMARALMARPKLLIMDVPSNLSGEKDEQDRTSLARRGGGLFASLLLVSLRCADRLLKEID